MNVINNGNLHFDVAEKVEKRKWRERECVKSGLTESGVERRVVILTEVEFRFKKSGKEKGRSRGNPVWFELVSEIAINL